MWSYNAMQPIRYLSKWLSQNASDKHYLFTLHDLRALCPSLSAPAFKTLLSRAVRSELLVRICRGLYLYKKALPADGLLLFHAAALSRADKFNYISLETVLSDAGVISQIPMNWISIMSSGRSSIIPCGDFGTIEFVHTNQKPAELIEQLTYDHNCGLWRANVALALRDINATHRNCDLIDWDIANELI
jgi:hypothetical protein